MEDVNYVQLEADKKTFTRSELAEKIAHEYRQLLRKEQTSSKYLTNLVVYAPGPFYKPALQTVYVEVGYVIT